MITKRHFPPRYSTGSATTGSAMVEFSLLLTVIVPVGLGMAMLGKLTDLRQNTEQASRYAAWEATVYSRQALAAQQQDTLESRFFMTPDAAISSRTQQKSDKSARNPLWGHSNARQGSLRELGSVSRLKDNQVRPSYQFDTGKAGVAMLSGKAAAVIGKPLSGFSGNSWGLAADGLLRAGVDVAVQPTGFLRGAKKHCGVVAKSAGKQAGKSSDDGPPAVFCLRTSGVILADGWSASGDAQAVSRIRSLVPGSTLGKVGKGVGNLLGKTIFPELDPLDKAFGHVDMSVLPEYAKPETKPEKPWYRW